MTIYQHQKKNIIVFSTCKKNWITVRILVYMQIKDKSIFLKHSEAWIRKLNVGP